MVGLCPVFGRLSAIIQLCFVIRSAVGYQSGVSAPVFGQHILEPKERVAGN